MKTLAPNSQGPCTSIVYTWDFKGLLCSYFVACALLYRYLDVFRARLLAFGMRWIWRLLEIRDPFGGRFY